MLKKTTPLIVSSVFCTLLSSPLLMAAPINQGLFDTSGIQQHGGNTRVSMARSGRYVPFTSTGTGNTFYVRDIKTQTATLISSANNSQNLSISPNGRYVAFHRTPGAVIVDRLTQTELVFQASSNDSIGLSDNGYAVFIRGENQNAQVVRLNIKNQTEEIIAHNNVNSHRSAERNKISANGQILLFRANNTYHIYNAATQQTIALNPIAPSGVPIEIKDDSLSVINLASTGKYVAFIAGGAFSKKLYRLNLESTTQTAESFDLTTKNIAIDSGPSISSDGRFMSFRGTVTPGHPDWGIANALQPDTQGQGYNRIIRYDTLLDVAVTMSTAYDGGALIQDSTFLPLWPIINVPTMISDDGSMVEYATNSLNVLSTPKPLSSSELNYHAYVSNGFNRNYQFVDIPYSDINFKPFAPMTLVGNNLWEGTITFDGVGAESFKFDVGGTLINGKFTATPHWAINFGAGSTANQAVANGTNIPVTSGAGTYKVTFNDQTLAYTVTKEVSTGDWQRTVVFIEGQTQSGQDMFIRGGIDHAFALNNLGLTCTQANKLCAIPIRHLNLRNVTTAPWKANDSVLDWYGAEASQSGASQGSPLDWTTNVWPTSWGTKRTVAIDGYGEAPLNLWGSHYWMFEVEMDCSKTVNGWFEVKSFISNGPGWESDVSQPNAPYTTGNHFAQCGKLNVFKRSQSNPVTIGNF